MEQWSCVVSLVYLYRMNNNIIMMLPNRFCGNSALLQGSFTSEKAKGNEQEIKVELWKITNLECIANDICVCEVNHKPDGIWTNHIRKKEIKRAVKKDMACVPEEHMTIKGKK